MKWSSVACASRCTRATAALRISRVERAGVSGLMLCTPGIESAERRCVSGCTADSIRNRLFLQDPRHPGLHFKRISAANPEMYSARVGAHYRVLGLLDVDTVIWFWIWTHEDYNNMVNHL